DDLLPARRPARPARGAAVAHDGSDAAAPEAGDPGGRREDRLAGPAQPVPGVDPAARQQPQLPGAGAARRHRLTLVAVALAHGEPRVLCEALGLGPVPQAHRERRAARVMDALLVRAAVAETGGGGWVT